MDIAYYLRQFTYDSWANDAAIESIEQLKAKDAENARKLMSHIFLSQKVWLMRLIGEEIPSDINIFPLYTIEECHRMTEEFNDFWREYLGNDKRGDRISDTLHDHDGCGICQQRAGYSDPCPYSFGVSSGTDCVCSPRSRQNARSD